MFVLLITMKITLCGSMTFLDEMKRLETELVARGHEVQRPEVKWVKNETVCPPETKAEAIREHFTKITWADAIVVVNENKKGIAGYVGGNTLMEMALAFHLGKTIYLTQQVPELSYKEEILGMLPRSIGELFVETS